jgi:hypothetical protein
LTAAREGGSIMATPLHTPYVPIELDKHRQIRFRHNDLADLEVQSGKGVGELMSGQTFHGLRLLLCYGLRWRDHKMTPTKAGDLIQGWIDDGGTFEDLTEKVLDALRLSGYLKSSTDEPEEAGGNGPAEAT